MKKVFIVGAKRTAIGTFGGSLKSVPAVELGVVAANGVFDQSGVSKDSVDETIIGNVLTAGQGMGPARQVSINTGIPVEKPAFTINMVCGSGMKSVMIGATDIMQSEASTVLCGGMENMSLAPYLLKNGRFGYRLGDGAVVDHLVSDGLTDIFNQYHMGITAENIAESHGISREEQDDFALESQLRAIKAIEFGKFKDEIVPVIIKNKKGDIIFDTDEHPKKDTSLDMLKKLRPAFKKDGTVTAGNSSGINDGASMTLLMSEDTVEKTGTKPIAEIVAFSQAGVDPKVMGLGPVGAIEKVLLKSGMGIKDIGLFELNEAFAVQSLGVLKDLGEKYGVTQEWLAEHVNVNGGAIALGHPIGCSGNRIIVSLIYEMKKRNIEYGLASLCIGGGMGTAIIIKNI